MNILRMRYFVDVAELENMTKAAQKNYISQTAMSQQIANMENELEVKLFTRDKGRLHLTEAGKIFYKDVLKVLECYDTAVCHAKDAWRAQYREGTIVVGVSTSTTVDYLEMIIRHFNRDYPDIHVQLCEDSFASMRTHLEQGSRDAVICPSCNLTDVKNVNIKFLAAEKMGLLVPLNHRYALQKQVSVNEIKDERIIMTTPEYAGSTYQAMLDARRAEGHTPNIVEQVSSATMLRMRVYMGAGCAYLPYRTAIYDRNKSEILEITDTNDVSEVCLAWKKAPDNHSLNYFAKLIIDFFNEEYEDWIRQFIQDNAGT